MIRIRRVPLIYNFIIGLIIAIMGLLVLWFMGYIDTGSILADILIIFVQWVFITGLALLGAIVLGMFVGHRIFALRGFTPFEEEMLAMRADMRSMNSRLEAIEKELGAIREDLEREK